jgi:hypothetical protein
VPKLPISSSIESDAKVNRNCNSAISVKPVYQQWFGITVNDNNKGMHILVFPSSPLPAFHCHDSSIISVILHPD